MSPPLDESLYLADLGKRKPLTWEGISKITIEDVMNGGNGIEKVSARELFGESGENEPTTSANRSAKSDTPARRGPAVMWFGKKHKGELIVDLMASDPGYIAWCLREVAGFREKVKAMGVDIDAQHSDPFDEDQDESIDDTWIPKR